MNTQEKRSGPTGARFRRRLLLRYRGRPSTALMVMTSPSPGRLSARGTGQTASRRFARRRPLSLPISGHTDSSKKTSLAAGAVRPARQAGSHPKRGGLTRKYSERKERARGPGSVDAPADAPLAALLALASAAAALARDDEPPRPGRRRVRSRAATPGNQRCLGTRRRGPRRTSVLLRARGPETATASARSMSGRRWWPPRPPSDREAGRPRCCPRCFCCWRPLLVWPAAGGSRSRRRRRCPLWRGRRWLSQQRRVSLAVRGGVRGGGGGGGTS